MQFVQFAVSVVSDPSDWFPYKSERFEWLTAPENPGSMAVSIRLTISF
jgi:hypothetical protein